MNNDAQLDLTAQAWNLRASGDVPPSIAGVTFPATVPGCAHTDLLAAGAIPDPFDGANESTLAWIGLTTWEYSTKFTWVANGTTRQDLVAEGLDTIAEVELNGIVVGRTENQHRSYRFDLRDALRVGDNSLSITFAPPVAVARAREAEHGHLPHVNHHPYNTLRKSASNFGWDWGIDVATSGIWKPIRIESWSSFRLERPRITGGLGPEGGVLRAVVAVQRDGVERSADLHGAVDVAGEQFAFVIRAESETAALECAVPGVEAWWPAGHGAQPLYDVDVAVADRAGRSDRTSLRTGFRDVTLDTTPDGTGSPFDLRVNGRTIQVRGANWIPDHAFLTEMDAERYRRRLDDAVDANMNLLRVWGGGIYESEHFYERCDELGVLVWQDFLFACAAYAEEDWLADEVREEAREQIIRLSPHPSLVIWNGNNENMWLRLLSGWRTELVGKTWGNGYYRSLLPELLAELDPSRPYSPASPYSYDDYLYPNDPENGTMHVWDVWNERDYSHYRDYRARFVSEFGFQGPPAWSTLISVVHDEPLDPYGVEMLVHQKAIDGNGKLERGMQGHLPPPRTIQEWHWAAQLNQAHAVRFGIEHYRSLAPYNLGTIVWQLNDNWPVISWAAVDFNEIRKPLWYAIQHAYRRKFVTIQPRGDSLEVILVNDSDEAWTGELAAVRMAFDGTVLATTALPGHVASRGSASIPLPPEIANAADAAREFVVVTPNGSGFDRAIWDFAEVVGQALEPDSLDLGVDRVEGGYRLELRARSYTRDVFVQADRVGPGLRPRTGMLTLLPGETAEIFVEGPGVASPALLVDNSVLRTANQLLTP